MTGRPMLNPRWGIVLRLTVFYLIAGVAGFALFKWIWPEHYFDAYPMVGICFWVLGMWLNFFLDKARTATPGKLTNIFMIFRVVKLMITILVIMIGSYLSERHATALIISILVNYIVYMVFELYIFRIYYDRIAKSDGEKLRK